MRNQWLHSLALSLGFLVLGGWVVGLPPSVRAEAPAPSIQAWPPAYASAPATLPPALSDQAAPAVTLDRPVALRGNRAVVDSEVRPTGLFRNRDSDAIAYSPASGMMSARPLPSGPAVDLNGMPLPSGSFSTTPLGPDVQSNWRQAPTAISSQAPPSGTVVPSPGIGPMPGMVTGPGIGGAPIGNPVSDGCVAPGGDCCMGGCCAPGCCGMDGCSNCCGSGWGGDAFGQGCCFGNRFYGTAEYLLWFIRGQPVPPLATVGSVNDNPAGAIGQPGTSVLNGGVANFGGLSGGRILLGYWFGPGHCLGVEAGGFGLAEGVNRFSAASGGTPFLARPFVNALTGAQDIEAVATPNGLSGSVNSVATSQLWGAQANLRSNLFCGCNWFIDGLLGWQYLGLHESLTVRENLTVNSSMNPNLPAGTTFQVTDHFGTQNTFNGAQIGGVGEYRVGRWFADVRATVGMGVTQQFVTIDGQTITQSPGLGTTVSQGGLLAQTSNIGRYTHEAFSVVPQIGLNIGYQFTNHIRGFVGYNFLYWSSVVRPGNQIDPVVNPNLIPPAIGGGPQRPAFNFNGSDFWAQGITFGLDFRW